MRLADAQSSTPRGDGGSSPRRGQEAGGQQQGGGSLRLRLRLRAPPPRSPDLGGRGRRWLAPGDRRSPYHTPARLPGNWD